MNDELQTATGYPKPLTRWWLNVRPCRKGVQLGPEGVPPAVELFVPWWGWPFELMHRLIFGRGKLTQV